MTERTLYWYDYESFGLDPRRHRVAQFAGLRTNEALEPLGEPLVLYCQPSDDFLPSPESCRITRITPQLAQQRGVNEAEFIRQIHQEFSRANTCVVGFNSIRFDDELTRQLLYRNFYDPYEREYKSGNSRWDIIDMLRLCAAIRPQGIQWPRNEDGQVTFRLEALTSANDISHADAHDALADVQATIAMARLVKQHQPRLYDYVYGLRSKTQVEAQLDTVSRKPVLHVSSRYPAEQGCLALVAPLCRHPVDSNGVIVYDLRQDPTTWLSLPVEEIQRRVFGRQSDLPAGTGRIALKVLHSNRCPVVAPAATLEPALAERFDIDLDAVQQHWQLLKSNRDVAGILAQVFKQQPQTPETDPDYMIYSGGFFGDADRKFMAVVRGSNAEQLASLNIPFKDSRLQEMLFRYRARNYPESLDQEDTQRWQQFRQARLARPQALADFNHDMAEARQRCRDAQDSAVLDELQAYVDSLLGALE